MNTQSERIPGGPDGGLDQEDTRSVEEWAQIMRALGEKPRLRIVRILLDGPRCVSDISEAAGLKIYNASRHLKTLREAGLVKSVRHGTEIHFDLSPSIRERIDSSGQTLDLGCCRFDFRKLDEELSSEESANT